jgi:Ca2+-binding EF-hand superfamily protein
MTEEQLIIEAVTDYVARVHGGDWQKAFAAADKDGDGRVNAPEIAGVLQLAGVGYSFTRGTISRRVVRRVDGNQDGFVTFSEFLQAFTEAKS